MNEDIFEFIKKWNSKYPIDFWWRKKYNIPFNSKLHRDQSMLDMRIEYEETVMYENHFKDNLDKLSGKSKYVPGKGMLFKKGDEEAPMTEDQLDEAFENLDISSIEENGDEIVY